MSKISISPTRQELLSKIPKILKQFLTNNIVKEVIESSLEASTSRKYYT
jgi:hypothetical protein